MLNESVSHTFVMVKETVFFALCTAMTILLLSPSAHPESAQKLKAHEEDVREQMLKLTKELGTTCTECHNVSDFKDASKKSFQIGAKHIKIVAVLKENGFDGKKGPEASCFMCHRGALHAPTRAEH